MQTNFNLKLMDWNNQRQFVIKKEEEYERNKNKIRSVRGWKTRKNKPNK